ncbi:DNA mismatch repair endonuclease MutL [Fibrobacterales bacterium]|nr:DNA mismatch repair endonuclease MutL [Fibrobacterales bacterium]
MGKTVQNKIQALSDHCINQIAAGEVIERPASVVKELVENAIDAGASSIEVHLVEGGIQEIKIIDNGSGISSDDLDLCYQRHTTSKLREAKEIFSVETSGFRGEALASIASIADLTITSRTLDFEEANEVHIRGGEVSPRKIAARDVGTTMCVREIFWNTPARRKFLSSPTAETTRISDILNKLALAWPEKSFRLLSGERELILCRGGSFKSRISEVLNTKLSRNMFEIDEKYGNLHLTGFIGSPEIALGRKNRQYFFLDRRPIENVQLSKALEKAWQAFFPGKHPVAILRFDFPRNSYDINVHPTKKEVRFTAKEEAFQSTHRILRACISGLFGIGGMGNTTNISQQNDDASQNNTSDYGTSLARTYEDSKSVSFSSEYTPPIRYVGHPSVETAEAIEKHKNDYTNTPLSQEFADFDYLEETEKPVIHSDPQDLFDSPLPLDNTTSFESVNQSTTSSSFSSAQSNSPANSLFQWNKSFIVTETTDGLWIVDQYLAHLRIQYEKALHSLNNSTSLPEQQVLFPEVIQLTSEEAELLEDKLDLLFPLGFHIEPFGRDAFRIQGIPSEMSSSRAKESIETFVKELLENQHANTSDAAHNLALAFARSTAIRRSTVLATDEMNQIIESLIMCDDPGTSPDGRRTSFKLGLEETRKKFGI